MTKPQTPENEVASDYFFYSPITNALIEELKKPCDGDRKDMVSLCREFEREVARLREESNTWHQHYRDEQEKAQKCKQAFIEQEKEVARLRELLEAAYGLCQGYDWNNGTHAKTHGYKRRLLEAVHALRTVPDIQGKRHSFGGSQIAPAPEERATPTCSNTTHKFSHCDCEEPATEWREFYDTDEIVQYGDQAMGWGSQDYWSTFPIATGLPAYQFRNLRFRTRRPLPVKEEMPLEDEIKRIETRDAWIDPTKDITACLRYLLGEIQKLKEAK